LPTRGEDYCKEDSKEEREMNVIQPEELHKKDALFTNCKDYEIKTLIVMRNEMDKEFARTTKKV